MSNSAMKNTAIEEGIHALIITKEELIKAPPALAFRALLEELGPEATFPDGKSMCMKLEAWPGGRWFRDLGNNSGHLWGHVQVIKPPQLIELCGPLFMSYPSANHVQYRLTEEGENTRLTLTHRAMGQITVEHREGVSMGWTAWVEKIQKRAESLAKVK